MIQKPTKLCACGCGKQIPPDETYPDKGPQYLDECWFKREDIRRLLRGREPPKVKKRG